MIKVHPPPSLLTEIKHNCDISDAKDHGAYSMCTMVLKLRNLYKWEHGIEPWSEPEPGDLLDWIEKKENYWETIANEPYSHIHANGQAVSPYDSTAINTLLDNDALIYGSGYGRSMKSVFFLAEILKKYTVEGCPVIITGKEIAKEMASPFAMSQDGCIYIRKESLRYFLWDQIQELRSSCRISLRHALNSYGLLTNNQLNHERFKAELDNIVEQEMHIFVYHEVGEILQTTFDTHTLQTIISHFPGSVVEHVSRALKDILADTHPKGVLAHIIEEQKASSLSFYIGFLDGLRKLLFPDIFDAFQLFLETGDWAAVEKARIEGQKRNLQLGRRIKVILQTIEEHPPEQILEQFKTEVLLPLGLDSPQEPDKAD